MDGSVIGDLVVDLIGKDHQMVLLGDLGKLFQHFLGVDRPGRVVGIDDHDGAGGRGDEAFHLVGIGHEAVLGTAGVVDGVSAVQHGGGGPERIVGTGQEHFVAIVQEGAHDVQDELRDAVAHEDVFHRYVGDAARLVEHDHRLAGREDTLLMAVAVGLAQVLDHGQAQRLGGAEAEGTGIADVELDDLVAGLFQFLGATCQGPADLVLDSIQVAAGLDRWHRHCDSPSSWNPQKWQNARHLRPSLWGGAVAIVYRAAAAAA